MKEDPTENQEENQDEDEDQDVEMSGKSSREDSILVRQSFLSLNNFKTVGNQHLVY